MSEPLLASTVLCLLRPFTYIEAGSRGVSRRFSLHDAERVGKVVVRIGSGFWVLQAPRRMRMNGGGRAQHEKGGGAEAPARQ